MLAFLVLALLMSPPAPEPASGDPSKSPPADPSVGVTTFHQVISLQGDDPSTEAREPRERVALVDRSSWTVPTGSDTG